MTGSLAGTLYLSRFGRAPTAWFEQAESSLSEAERRRLPKHSRDGAWRRHILSRRLMRFAAAARLGRPDIPIGYPDHSSPCLESHSHRNVGVSLSHCCETVAVVIADHPIVGCDILSLARPVRWQHIAASFFSEADYAWIMEAPEAAKERFGSLWCIKEALAKCSGKPLLECLRQNTADVGPKGYWARSGTVADCAFAVASDTPLAVDILEVAIEAL